jgi:endonuclease/exonuclease/phosphatase (EEP) superfamily protein YafD
MAKHSAQPKQPENIDQLSIGWPKRYLVAASQLYLAFLGIWIWARWISGDRYLWVAMMNLWTIYWFIPCLGIVLVALWSRRRDLWFGLALMALLFLVPWGRYYLPGGCPSPDEQQLRLRVMTYNIFSSREDVQSVLDSILAQDADLVLLLELNPPVAEALRDQLADEYPYQWLDPRSDPFGLGTLSRNPFRITAERLEVEFVGDPQIFVLEWQDQEIMVVNYHMWALSLAPADIMKLNFGARDAQALHLANFARSQRMKRPLLIMGDTNSSELSEVYELLDTYLDDAWAACGQGLGHTFPASPTETFEIGPITGHLPERLFRLDYIFHSPGLRPVAAWVGPADGFADHHPVLAEFVLATGE